MTYGHLLKHYVALQEIATRKQIRALAQKNPCPPERKILESWGQASETGKEAYIREVQQKGLSLIDLLKKFPACALGFGQYLSLLNPLKPRYFSISSAPRQQTDRLSLTVGVLRDKAWSGQGVFQGICTNYLAGLNPGDQVQAYVQETHSFFRPPQDSSLPVLMIGAGTGLAPFRAFLQERALAQKNGQKVGKSLLFFGCRHPEQDYIYQEELEAYAQSSLTGLYLAFSRLEAKKIYVQHKVWEQLDRVWELIVQGGIVYVCGDTQKLAPAVRQTFVEIYQRKTGASPQKAGLWLQDLISRQIYREDIWA